MIKKDRSKKPVKQRAAVISTVMGLGHMRAAYPLRELANYRIDCLGTANVCDSEEYELWQKMLRLYYFFSRSESIPIIGKYLFHMMITSQEILPYYPKRDLSAPNWAVRYLEFLITKRNLGRGIIEKIRKLDIPVIHSYFASAIAVDKLIPHKENNYCMICDTDINRVWVADNPKKSNIKYLVPCEVALRRLLAYGVDFNKIFLTGFPLPKENIGSERKMEILKNDLFNRLVRLDPYQKFFRLHEKSVLHRLEKRNIPAMKEDIFTLMFAIGGAGAQYNLAKEVIYTLREKIKQRKIKMILSLGVQADIYRDCLKYLKKLHLSSYLNNGIKIAYHENIFDYFNQFNNYLHETDILWTKPSEMCFYTALGLPILLAPPIGTHEEYNKRWLIEMNSGVEPEAAVKYCDEWIFDLRVSGRWAEAAYNGYLKAPKRGVYNIERLINTGKNDFIIQPHIY